MIGLFHCPARLIHKFVLMAKMSLEENFETHLKEKYERTKRTKLRSRYPRLSSWFLRDFGGKQATNGEDEHDEDNSTRELNDVIAAERSSNKKKKTKKTKCEWKTFEGFADSRQMDILMNERTHCCSRKAPWQFLKMPPSKMLASTNQTVFQAFEKAYSSYLRLARLSLYVHSSKSLAK